LATARVLYFGDPRGASHLLDLGVTLCGVVHGRRGGPGWQALMPRLANVPRWMRPDLEDAALVAALAATGPTLLASGFYPRRIPQHVLDLAPGFNVHPSDLPRWRGPDPAWWTIRAGDATTAICVHHLETGLDEGAVVYRETIAVGPRETGGHLAARMEALAAQRLAEVVARVAAGEHLPATPQAGETTWAPLVEPEACEIDWKMPAVQIDRLVRAAAPDPGAFTGIGDELLVIFAGEPVPAGRFAKLEPGNSFVRNGWPCIRCGDAPAPAPGTFEDPTTALGAYRITRSQLGRRRMGGRELARLLS
jgi:methionyl-tRNA formyltransferase